MNIEPDFFSHASAFTGGIVAVGSFFAIGGWWLNAKFSNVYKQLASMDKGFTASMVAHEMKDVERFNELKDKIKDVQIQKIANVLEIQRLRSDT